MTDIELIDYCEAHSWTERALFPGKQINRILALAGHPEGYVHSIKGNILVNVHEELGELCDLARKRLAALKEAKHD